MTPHDGSDLIPTPVPAAVDVLGDAGLLGAIAAAGDLEAEFPHLVAAALAHYGVQERGETAPTIELCRQRAAYDLAAIA